MSTTSITAPDEVSVPEEFDKYGDHFTQLKRTGRVVIYKRERPNGEHLGYEVMVIRIRKESMIRDKVMPGGEALPSSSLWGTFGWSYLSSEAEKTELRFANCCKRFNPKPVRRIVRRVA